MYYQHLAPTPALAELVDRYLLIHYQFDSTQTPLFKPYPARPEQVMTFTIEGYDLLQTADNCKKERIPINTFFGQPLSRINLYTTASYKLFRVFFRPGALFRLFGMPMTELTDQCIDVEAYIGQEVREVNERLAQATTSQEMVDIVNAYLLKKQAKRPASQLDRVANVLLKNPTYFSLDWLADQACLSPRQFNRRFSERMGVGPKLYARIARYYAAFQFRQENPTADWLSIALRYGYTDVQHLGKDFRQFAGVTPNTLIHQAAQSPEIVFKLV